MIVYKKTFYKRGLLNMESDNSEKKEDGINIHISGKTIKYITSAIIMPIILSIISSYLYDKIIVSKSINKIDDRLSAIEQNINNVNTTNNFNFLQPTANGKIGLNYDEVYLEASATNDRVYISDEPPSNDDNNIDESLTLTTADRVIYSLETPTWELSDKIATDVTNGKEYTAKELINKKILLPYKSENQECFFYGQFNGNNHWNGNCIINIYENNNLISIMESTYDDGRLLAYKQVFESSKADYDVWSFSDRVNYPEYSTGKTWRYFKYEEYTKTFSFENVTPNDILNVNSFESFIIDNGIEEYYYGRTSDGLFNDSTGDAYMVKYFQNGITRLIYCGDFKNGLPNDYSNKAWHIVKGENTPYMYYKGHFEDNKKLNNLGFIFENNLTLDRINELLEENKWKDKNYEFELKFDCSYSKEQGS